MLDTFRENARSWVIQTVIAAVAVVFIFSFGPGSRGCRAEGSVDAPTWAAKVNGETIPASQFQSAYGNRFEFQRQMRRGTYSEAEAAADDLRSQTMKDVVDQELVAQAARAHGLWVSDDELFDNISKDEKFKRSGNFDPKTYEKYVNNVLGLSASKYEERLRRDLTARKMFDLVRGTIAVGDDELKAEFMKAGEGASIEYVRFVTSQYLDQVEVTDADIQRILKDRRADIDKRYEDSKSLYVEPRAIKALRVFVALKAEGTPEDETAAKAKIDEAKKALDGGQKFEDVAAKFSSDATATDLGWVSLGRSGHGKTLEEALFKLKPGETSDVVRDRLGFNLVKAVEERQASTKALADVEKDLARDLVKDEKSKELTKAAATAALEKLKAGETLAAQFPREEAKEGEEKPSDGLGKKPQALPTEVFHPYGGIIPGIGSVPKVTSAVFALSADKRTPDAPIEDQNAYFVFELKTRERPDMAKFEEQKAELRTRLVGQKQAELRKAWLESLRKEAKVVENDDLLSYDQATAGVRRRRG